MADDRTYYVFCDDNCKFPSMTKEQIITAIANATGLVPSGINIDDAIITKIKEQNGQIPVKLWVGEQSDWNALNEKPTNTLALFTDDDEIASLEASIIECAEKVESFGETLTTVNVPLTITPTDLSADVVKVKAQRSGNVVMINGMFQKRTAGLTIKITNESDRPKSEITVVAAVDDTTAHTGGSYKTVLVKIGTNGVISADTSSSTPFDSPIYFSAVYGV